MFHPNYTGAVALLSKSLASRDILIPPGKPLYDAFLNYFEDNDMFLAASIMGTVDTKRDWHYIEIGASRENKGSLEFINLTDSFASAIATVVDEIDSTHIYPDAIRVVGNSLQFHKNDELMYKVGKVEFAPFDQSLSERCRAHFKGIRSYGDKSRLVNRLQAIPNLEKLSCEEERPREDQGHSMVAMVENFPIFMRSMLSTRFNIEIKQSVALEIVAETFGAKSWNVFKAAADKLAFDSKPVLIYMPNTQPSAQLFYKNIFDGLAGLSKVVAGYPGRDSLVIELAGAATADTVYVNAYNPAFDKKFDFYTQHQSELELFAPVEVSSDEEGTENFAWVNDAPYGEVASKLNDILLVTSPLKSRLAATNERNNQRVLSIGKYLFTVFDAGQGRDYLKVELLVSGGGEVNSMVKPAVTAIYKAEIVIQSDGVMILGDYGHDKIAALNDFTDLDIKRLTDFTGIKAARGAAVQ